MIFITVSKNSGSGKNLAKQKQIKKLVFENAFQIQILSKYNTSLLQTKKEEVGSCLQELVRRDGDRISLRAA